MGNQYDNAAMNTLFRISLSIGASYLRNVPIKNGRWRIIKYFLPMLRANGSKLGEKIVHTQYGFLFNADLGDWLGQYVYLTGCYEPPTARVIATLLNPGDTFIDVGANSGFFTLLGSHVVGANGRVLAFEPVPSMRSRLNGNLSLNSAENVVIHDIALSNKAGKQLFHEGPPGHKGLSSLRSLSNEATTFSVSTMPLDDLLDDEYSINLIKIDVEGAEQLVINGMQRLLARQKPHIVIEVTDGYLNALGNNAVTLCQSLCDLGYRMYRIAEEELIPMEPNAAAKIAQYNALFTCKTLPTSLN